MQGHVKRAMDLKSKYAKTAAQVALRWLVEQPLVSAIPMSSRKERCAENFDIFDFALDEADRAAIAQLPKNGRLLDFGFASQWDDQ